MVITKAKRRAAVDVATRPEVISDAIKKMGLARKGYRLYDAAVRPIPDLKHFATHMGLLVEKQADFFRVARENIERFPSPDGLRELAVVDVIMAIEVDRAARRSLHENRMQQRAVELHRMLTRLSSAAGANVTKRLSVSDLDRPLKAAIREAEYLLGEIDDQPFAEDILESERWQVRRDLPDYIDLSFDSAGDAK
jgi:hypothetical protein